MSDLLPFVVVGLVSGSIYALAGIGLVLTYKTSGILNFAHGTVAAVVAYCFYELRDVRGLPWPVAMLACLLVVSPIVGFALEQLARRLSTAAVATKTVATLGVLIAVQQLAVIRYGAETRAFDTFLPTQRVRILGVNVEWGQIIVMALVAAAAGGLSLFFRSSRLGRGMRAVVDDADLLALNGTSPVSVRRWAWCIGSAFAGLSGILFAPVIGLDASILTLLVVQAFGAAAVGLFTSIPMTYVGGLAVGVGAAISTKYVGHARWLSGVPPSIPFIVLFLVLVLAPRRRLTAIVTERPRRAVAHRPRRPVVRAATALAGVAALGLVPSLAGTRLVVFIAGGAYLIVFLSLALVERTSGQTSLAQLAFAAVGASTFSHLAGAGTPWLLAVLASAAVAVPAGAVVAIPAIRLSGVYLALATLGFGLLLERLVFPTGMMFGGTGGVRAPRPSIATSDTRYWYVVAAFVVASIALVAVVERSRLGRLLRAMGDSPVALATHGSDVTVLKVLVFCVSAFLAGLGGALLGPVTGRASVTTFGIFASLLLVVVLALQGPVREVRAAVGAAIAFAVLPSYLSDADLNRWLPVVFGISALLRSLADAQPEGRSIGERLTGAANLRLGTTPVKARLAQARAATTFETAT